MNDNVSTPPDKWPAWTDAYVWVPTDPDESDPACIPAETTDADYERDAQGYLINSENL